MSGYGSMGSIVTRERGIKKDKDEEIHKATLSLID
jgi:hypothetical protein